MSFVLNVKISTLTSKIKKLPFWLPVTFFKGVILVLLTLSFSSNSSTLISEPTFSRLSSENGLSQNTITSLLLDDEGFLWLGTESGLNRFDGYQAIQVTGSENQLADAPISYLFQDSRKNMWIGDYISGVSKFNLQTNTVEPVIDMRHKFDQQLRQTPSFITEDKEGNIWFAMNESVVWYSYHSDELTIEYTLPDEMIKRSGGIRTLLVSDDILFLGTTEGLYGLVKGSRNPILIEHAPAAYSNLDSNNVKMLHADDRDNLWIGTVEGLFSLTLSEAKRFTLKQETTLQKTLHIQDRNIWKFVETEGGLFYIVTDQGLFSYHTNSTQLQHIFLPADSRDYMSSDVLKDIIIDKNKNFWLGTEADGALYWSPNTTLFNNIYNPRGGRGEKVLSNNNVWSVFQENSESLWIGTRNGLNLYNIPDGETDSFITSADHKAQFSASSIIKILSAENGVLWMHTGDGLLHFDSKTRQPIPLKVKTPEAKAILNSQIWSTHMKPNGDILLLGGAGFNSYFPDTGEIKKLESVSKSIDSRFTVSLSTGLPSKPNTTLIASYGELWQLDNDSGETTLIHKLPLAQQQAEIYADGVLIDSQGIMWISYPAYGLVGLDATTFEQKFFYNKDNLFTSNVIFDMQKDMQGKIWLGSNSGLIKFDPITHHIQKYGYEQGLANVEFNSDASATLTDGRIVYGSPKGLTFFDPDKLYDNVRRNLKVAITSLSISSKQLFMPLNDLDGQSIELAHDDVGLLIHFSTLQYEGQKSTRYLYHLSGKSELSYPVTSRSEVMFPKLEPGNYVFSVSAFHPADGKETEKAVVNIRVHYAPWASPLAYAFYGLVIVIGLSFLWWYRRAHSLRLRAAHQEVLQSKNKMTLALSASKSDMWEYQSLKNSFFAPRLTQELGYGQDTISFEKQLSLVHNHDRAMYKTAWNNFINSENAELDVTFRMISNNGAWLWFHDVGRVVEEDKYGKAALITGTYTNVTDTIVNQENLRLFGEAFKHTHDWVLIYDHKRNPITCNDAFKHKFDVRKNTELAAVLKTLHGFQNSDTSIFWRKMLTLQPGEHWKGEDKIIFADGDACDALVHINVVANIHDKNKIKHYLVIISDITEQKAAENKLRSLANFDALTGLPNRTLLLDRIEHGLEHALRYSKNLAVFFIDLDKFKQVNDSLGHKAGDELLIIIAKRLSKKLRKEDTVARLGGDEFVIMVEDVHSAEAISVLVSEIIAVINLPVGLSNQTVSVSSSIGIAMYPGDGGSAEELLKNADIAMYHAKEQGRSNFQFFTQQMDDLVKSRLVLENKLKAAHQSKKFENYYQPIINTETKCVEGFEILMRWPTKDGMVPPDKFIPVSEELGLIEHMTLDAFERAMPILNSMRTKGFNGYLSVNLSARHFESQSSIDRIMLLLEQHQIPVNAIRFEITESALMRDYDKALIYMTQIQQKGFIIALDDFGTGFSSLKYLKEFPINVIKVDKSFVDDIGKNQNNEAIILTTLSMAKQLKMSCVAEGIENKNQVNFFNENQCHHLQGYYFSKPVPAEGIVELLQKPWLDSLNS